MCHHFLGTWYLILGTWYRHLGYPPKFYRVQDANSCNNSWFWYHFGVISTKNHQNTCFSTKVAFNKKKTPARKPANSRPEWGSTPRWSLFQNLGTGKFKTFLMKIHQKWMDFIYFALFPLRIGGIGLNNPPYYRQSVTVSTHWPCHV